MAKSIIVAGGPPPTVATSTTTYFALFGYLTHSTTESFKAGRFRDLGTFSRLAVRCQTNGITATSTFRLRKNAGNGNQTVSITTGSTGLFEDTSNTDTVSAGTDEFDYQIITGSTGTNLILNHTVIVFEPTDTTRSVTKIGTTDIGAFTTASSTTYANLSGYTGGAAVETNYQHRIKRNGKLKYLNAEVSANARTTATTIRTRINTANGLQSVSVGSTATGTFEDTTNSDTLAVSDLINFSFTTGTGTQSTTISFISASFEFSNNQVVPLISATSGDVTAPATTYGILLGGLLSKFTSPSDANIKLNFGYNFMASNLQIKLRTNANTATNTATLYKNDSRYYPNHIYRYNTDRKL